jgi:hypothetical protein
MYNSLLHVLLSVMAGLSLTDPLKKGIAKTTDPMYLLDSIGFPARVLSAFLPCDEVAQDVSCKGTVSPGSM